MKFWEQIGNKTGKKAIKNKNAASKNFVFNLCLQKQL
jgi:hypothetical protein